MAKVKRVGWRELLLRHDLPRFEDYYPGYVALVNLETGEVKAAKAGDGVRVVVRISRKAGLPAVMEDLDGMLRGNTYKNVLRHIAVGCDDPVVFAKRALSGWPEAVTARAQGEMADASKGDEGRDQGNATTGPAQVQCGDGEFPETDFGEGQFAVKTESGGCDMEATDSQTDDSWCGDEIEIIYHDKHYPCLLGVSPKEGEAAVVLAHLQGELRVFSGEVYGEEIDGNPWSRPPLTVCTDEHVFCFPARDVVAVFPLRPGARPHVVGINGGKETVADPIAFRGTVVGQ